MNTGQIKNPAILVKPSEKLCAFIKTVSVTSDIPVGVANCLFKNKVKREEPKQVDLPKVTTAADREFIKTLKLNRNIDIKLPVTRETTEDSAILLSLSDLHWLHSYIQSNNEKVYLHELLEGSEIVLPKNSQIPRNPELEKRCLKLRASQENRAYSNMTKNVDNVRKKHPEDTISYQIKQMNRHLIAIAQFIMSVLAGFAFGFIGVELLIGSLDFGFRLLLGIICALIIALAELYFLAKKLNEDLKFETIIETKKKTTKLD